MGDQEAGQEAGPQAVPPGDELQEWPTGRLLSTAARLVEHAWDEALTRFGLTHSRLVVAHLLSRAPATQRDLARRSGVQEQTMGRILRGMEQNGQVARARDEADRRRSVVTLTAPGREALEAVLAAGGGEDLVRGIVEDAGLDGERFRASLIAVVGRLSARRWPQD